MPTALPACTHAQVWYTLAIRMAATHLLIDKQEALLGDTFWLDRMSMEVVMESERRCRRT